MESTYENVQSCPSNEKRELYPLAARLSAIVGIVWISFVRVAHLNGLSN